jgi:hypothetical protein
MNIAKLPELLRPPGGCCRYGTVKGKVACPYLFALALHGIRRKDCLVLRPFRGEWGIWSPGGRPARAASFLLAVNAGHVASVAAFTICHSGVASLAGNACTQLTNRRHAAAACRFKSSRHLPLLCAVVARQRRTFDNG